MTRVDLSTGFILSVILYRGTKYTSDTVNTALEVLVSLGFDPRMASFHDVDASAASPRELHEGAPNLVQIDFTNMTNRKLDGDRVFASVELDYAGIPIQFGCRLRTKFYEDDTFSVTLDIPFTGLFEESKIDSHAKMFAWMSLESLAAVLFSSSPYLYGGIYIEDEAPSLHDLERGAGVLPTDAGLFSRTVVDLVGREELFRHLRTARKVLTFPDGGLYFSWSDWQGASRQDSALSFKQFIRRVSPCLSVLRRK